MTVEAPSPIKQQVHEAADDEVHVVCCEDENLAMCSWDVSDKALVEAHAVPTCAVCADLDGTDFCPKRGNMTCSWCHIPSKQMRHG